MAELRDKHIDVEVSNSMDNHSDQFALAALYDATGGANWRHNYNWSTEAPFSEWDGVTIGRCGRVSELDLGYNRLSSVIPAELAQLTNLKTLDLSANELTGPIPPELALLTKLETLHLDDNRLTGTIPVELTQITSWLSVSFGNNQLTGSTRRV